MRSWPRKRRSSSRVPAAKASKRHQVLAALTDRTGLLYAMAHSTAYLRGAVADERCFWRERFRSDAPGDSGCAVRDIAALEQQLNRSGSPRTSSSRSRAKRASACRRTTIFVRRRTFAAATAPCSCRRGADWHVPHRSIPAAHHYGVDPDMVILAKALSGGLVPIGAVLMTDAIYDSRYDSLKRAIVHTSTFSENGLSMRAGLATLDVLETERLGDRAPRPASMSAPGSRNLAGFEMVKEVRGVGMFSGIEFRPPTQFTLRVAFGGFLRIHPGLFGQMLVMRMFRDKNILTQMCGNNFMVLKVAPPLTVSDRELDRFVDAITEVVELVHLPPPCGRKRSDWRGER